MHRGPLLDLLGQYLRRYPDEADCVERFITFVRAQPRCFERGLERGHITGSAWIVSEDGGSVLLNHHRKLDQWMQFGGHADGCSDVRAVAVREAVEETGLADLVPAVDGIFDLDIHPIPPHHGDPEHLHYDVRFALRVVGSHAAVASNESHDVAWVGLDEVTRYTDEPSMLRMLAKWRSHRAIREHSGGGPMARGT